MAVEQPAKILQELSAKIEACELALDHANQLHTAASNLQAVKVEPLLPFQKLTNLDSKLLDTVTNAAADAVEGAESLIESIEEEIESLNSKYVEIAVSVLNEPEMTADPQMLKGAKRCFEIVAVLQNGSILEEYTDLHNDYGHDIKDISRNTESIRLALIKLGEGDDFFTSVEHGFIRPN